MIKADAILAALDVLALRRLGDSTFGLVGAQPPWAPLALGGVPEGDRVRIDDRAPFLEHFLTDADAAWSGQFPLPHSSGLWNLEDGEGNELMFEAAAMRVDGEDLLVVTHGWRRVSEIQELFQRSREHLLQLEDVERERTRKEILVHCIVHDLVGPLASLRILCDLLAKSPTPDKLLELRELGIRQIANQQELIDDILTAYKEEAGALVDGTTPTMSLPEAGAALRELVVDMGAQAAARGARIEVAEDGDPAHVLHGEASRLVRMVRNLIENALRFTPVGGVVTVGLEPADDEAYLLRVEDQGPGLEPGSENEVFEQLRQGRGGKGKVGLGLYYCRITARSWGGDVGCENRSEGGARFWIRLPRPALAGALA